MSDQNHPAESPDLARLERRVEQLNTRFRRLLVGALLTLAAAVLLGGPWAMAAPEQPDQTVYDDLYQFSANTPAVASEVNSNFATLRGQLHNLAAAIGTLDSQIGSLQNQKLNKSGGTVSGNLTVNGRLNVGLRRKSCAYPNGGEHGDCACSSNEVVLGGGSYGAVPGGIDRTSLRESRPLNARTWRVACTNEHGRRANCAAIDILCARM